PAITQIIGAKHDNDVRGARLRQYIAVEAPKPAVATDVVQDAVAAEPVVHYADRSACPGHEPPCQLIRPAAEGVDRRDVAVGQRVAERDYSECVARGEHVDAAKEEPLVGQIPDRHHCLSGEIAGWRDVIGLPCVPAGYHEIRRHIAGQMETDCKISERWNGKVNRIAVLHRPGCNDSRVAAAEAYLAAGACDDRRTLVTQRNHRGADDQWTIAVGI